MLLTDCSLIMIISYHIYIFMNRLQWYFGLVRFQNPDSLDGTT